MKKLLLSFVALLMGVGAMAEEVTVSFDASQQEYENATAIENITIADGITATFDVGANTYKNSPKYYTTGTAIRCYPDNTITFVSAKGEITDIVFTFSSGEKDNEITVSTGEFADSVWTGRSESVTFTIGGTSGHRRIKAMTVTYEASADAPVVDSLVVTGTPEITSYYLGETPSADGLVVTAYYDDATTKDVTEYVTWTFDPKEIEDVEQTEVVATAFYAGKAVSKVIEISEVKTIANTPETAYTIEEAVKLIDAGKGLSTKVYVKGKISKVEEYIEKYSSITYWISADGSEEGQQFQCYSGKNIGGEDFASVEDLKVGASVVVYGELKKHGDVYEFNYNNEIVSVTTTGIGEVSGISASANGKFVENGRIVIVKDGKKFNVAGQVQNK